MRECAPATALTIPFALAASADYLLPAAQAAVMGQLVTGILLGPSVFGAIWPEAQRAVFAANPQQQGMLDGVSQLGILMLLLLTGMETDLRLVKQACSAAIGVSVAGIVLPFACGFALGELLPAARLPEPGQRIITSLILGTALSGAHDKGECDCAWRL